MPGEVASSVRFQAYTKMTGYVDAGIKDDFRWAALGVGVTWVDAFRAAAGGRPWLSVP